MKRFLITRYVSLAVAMTALAYTASAQSSFQNFDFESAMPPFVVIDPTYGAVAVSNSVPGWSPYIGSGGAGIAVLYNNYFIGTPAVALLGPGWTNQPQIIEGSYSILLQGGAYPSSGPAFASIAQVGLLPAGTKSIEFKGNGVPISSIGLFVAGQSIPVFPLSTTPSYTLYGADVSQFAGQVAELRLTALVSPTYPFPNLLVDSFEFSNTAIPEPSTIGISIFGASLLGWRLLRARRR